MLRLPILDGNVKRVLARLTAHPRPPARDDALFWSWSEALLDPLAATGCQSGVDGFGGHGLHAALSPPVNAAPGGCTVLPTLPANLAAGP